MPVPVSFEGCYERISLAREHLNGLNEEIETYLASDPAETSLEMDGEEGYDTIEFRIKDEPPMRWSLVVGEVGYNLRAGLDHLVHQLAVWNGAHPDKDRTQFPMFTRHSDYAKTRGKGASWRTKMLKGIGKQHRAMI